MSKIKKQTSIDIFKYYEDLYKSYPNITLYIGQEKPETQTSMFNIYSNALKHRIKPFLITKGDNFEKIIEIIKRAGKKLQDNPEKKPVCQ